MRCTQAWSFRARADGRGGRANGGGACENEAETEEAKGVREGEDARTPRHPELLELDSPEYAGKLANRWVVERLLAMGGVRLAGVLTDILADVAGDMQA
ncbi:hypothetical protein NUW54_g6561 [Trametes sanguinea]|uniref:Uncharacterized protein n=1 Tax=Trametes sanguinea TaxID=158606 RepID=A0ACC1PSE2_9APHY|nr:hypothetical protein NUW54_g6561 [Trametes sanguinea]